MPTQVCYLGDGALTGPASYLAGIMLHYGITFDHVPSDSAPPDDFFEKPYALYVVSDYPASRFGEKAMRHAAERVKQGAGLAMFGGWESYFGRLGEYHRSPLADVLPVVMAASDDRRNYAQPCLVNKSAEHPILAGLPWNSPPGIGGFNAIAPKPESQTVLTSIQFSVTREGDSFDFQRGEERPLLIVGTYGHGRAAALATDVAPHWVGGFVDWGDSRVVQEVAAGECIDVGNWYAQFFRNLLVWTGQF